MENQSFAVSTYWLNVWFWGLLYVAILLGIPAYYGIKKYMGLWLNPLDTKETIISIFIKIFLVMIISQALADIVIALTDKFYHSKYYLHEFLKYLSGGG
jgi:hypothetical protein